MLRRLLPLAVVALLAACSGPTTATGHHTTSTSTGGGTTLGGHLAGGNTGGTTGHTSATTGTSSTTGFSTGTTTTSGVSSGHTTSTSGFTTSTSTSGTTSTSTSTSSTSTSTSSTSTSSTSTSTSTSGTTTSGTTTGTSSTSTSTSTSGTTGANLPPGSPCTTYLDCAGGGCVPATLADGGPSGWTGGYCSPDCTGNAAACGTQACADFGSFASCQGSCGGPGAGQSSCRTGYSCFYYDYPDGGLSTATDGVCGPACSAPGASCLTGSSCDAQGYCDAWNLDAGVAGSPCTSDSNCGPSTAGFCLLANLPDGGATIWTGGMCTAVCTGGAYNDALCGGGYCSYYGATGICEQPCTTPYTGRGNCRSGYTCVYVYDSAGTADTTHGVCESDCTVTGCTDPNGVYIYCHATDGYCYSGP